MYTDFLMDPKMIGLAFEDQRHFVGVLALKCDGAIDDVADDVLLNRIVAQRLWIDHGVISEVKCRLVAAGLIDANWQPIAWNSRQFVSDKDATASERKRRERAKKDGKPDVTDMSRVTSRTSHGNVTRLDTDSDKEGREEQSGELRSPPPSAPAAVKQRIPKPADTVPHKEILALWAAKMPNASQPKEWTPKRAELLRSRWRGDPARQNLNWWAGFFDFISTSVFLTGRAPPRGKGKPFRASLDWVLNVDNFAKIREADYHDDEVAA
jgi:hypothetical protein